MGMKELYLIRSQSCGTCGLTTINAIADSVAQANGAKLYRVQLGKEEAVNIVDKYDGIEGALLNNRCIYFYPQGAKWVGCGEGRDRVQALFNEE
jgi:hypothetical protein